jgi:hypothetical protein
MIKNLLARLGFQLVKVEETAQIEKKTQRQIVEERKSFSNVKAKVEDLNKSVQEIQGQIIAQGYRAIPDILEECSERSVEQFVRLQLVNLGAYDPERNNLDGMSKAELIKLAVHNNREQFRQRCVERGDLQAPSDGQLDLIQKLAESNGVRVDFNQIKDRFEASDKIEELQEVNNARLKRLGINPMSKEASDQQIETIHKLCSKLGLQVAAEMYEDRKTASAVITNLVKQAPKTENQPATEAQVEYAMRLWVSCGHKKTAKKEQSFKDMTSLELSKKISEMKKEFAEKNPDANNPSEGQLSYIKQLFEICMLPQPTELPRTKQEATALINKMNKKYLYILTRATNPSLKESDINKMTSVAVKELIAQTKMENLTKFYSKNPTTGGAEADTNIAF